MYALFNEILICSMQIIIWPCLVNRKIIYQQNTAWTVKTYLE